MMHYTIQGKGKSLCADRGGWGRRAEVRNLEFLHMKQSKRKGKVWRRGKKLDINQSGMRQSRKSEPTKSIW